MRAKACLDLRGATGLEAEDPEDPPPRAVDVLSGLQKDFKEETCAEMLSNMFVICHNICNMTKTYNKTNPRTRMQSVKNSC